MAREYEKVVGQPTIAGAELQIVYVPSGRPSRWQWLVSGPGNRPAILHLILCSDAGCTQWFKFYTSR